jgi:hypothetical protein
MIESNSPSPEQLYQQQLLKILDGVGTEADIRCLVIGGTVESHLKVLQSHTRPQ